MVGTIRSRSISLMLVLALLLAGCTGDPKPQSDPEDALEQQELKATEDTGVLRGVVVDEAIRPVADATVSIACTGHQDSQTTGTDGVFGFEGVPPGTCAVTAEKVGYFTATQQADVVADVARPPAVRLLLTVDPENRPFFEEMKFEGFIECSFSLVAAGHATCDLLPNSNNEFLVEYFPERPPAWAQSEMIWESTQSASTELALVYSADLTDATLLDNWVEVYGTNPVLGTANSTRIQEVGLGTNISLMIRVFNQHNEGTAPPDPVEGDDCVDRPALGGCLRGLGATIQQEFTVFTHLFYGYEPKDGWRFSSGDPVPAPEQ